MKGYKAFNQDMTCQGYQFQVGETYTHKGEIRLCQSGFHFCKEPFDILKYYDLYDSRFCMIEATGEINEEENVNDSKCVTSEIKIVRELSLSEFIEQVNGALFKQASSGDGAQQASSGDGAQQVSSGYGAVSCAIGRNSKIKSSIGSWIVLAEYGDDRVIDLVRAGYIDGVNLSPGVYYRLEKGEFVECDE